MKLKATVMDERALRRALMRISHEIVERNADLIEDSPDRLCLVGILRRGVPIAAILKENVESLLGCPVPLGTLDITLYRDDLSRLRGEPKLSRTDINFSIEGRTVILVDDVLYTGRTTRAAIEAIFTAGRPRAIQLLVLIDRGHRELPFRADYVGKNIPTSHSELVEVRVPPYDAETGVWLMDIA